ncbi:hypothetical protein B0I32_105430 [Nonomuraea fuscirosea]|uniref:Uncharacterized protein n=1 Tax=Nonomuraea fuscirosea TaxID=1291556 RepID=A0A2T0N4D1_9ACTN|nr:hypothetical protein [Nonomuraea fuscirosea]PRX66990.1 hypothetical protein B0I32_105430 [Nonomuraea fuscirosea]
MVAELAARPDRAAYTLPAQLRALQDLRSQEAYLPSYVIEIDDGRLLGYMAAGPGRDAFLEAILAEVPEARVESETRLDERRLWEEWLAGNGLGHGSLRRASYGGWCCRLRRSARGGSCG